MQARWVRLFSLALFFAASTARGGDCPGRSGIRVGATPILNYTSDRGLTLGVLAQRFDYRDRDCPVPFRSVVTLEASYATEGERLFEIDLDRTEVTAWNLRTSSVLSFGENDDQYYYGVGPRSVYRKDLDPVDYYRYRDREVLLENSIRKRIDALGIEPQLGLGFAESALAADKPASQYEADFGRAENRFFTTRIFLRNVWEHRDSEFTPSRGYYALAGVTAAPAGLGDYGASWYRIDGDYRLYTPLAENRWLWLANQLRYAGTTDATPISDKARLGSVGTLRGLPFSRYLANHSASFRTDIRSLWFREEIFGLPFKVGTGIFYDLGKVADRIGGFADERFHHSYGFSIFGSYFTDDFLGSADFGFSEGSTAFYVRLGHPF